MTAPSSSCCHPWSWPRFGEAPRRQHHLRQRIVRLSVGEHDEDAVGERRAGLHQLPALLQHRGQRRPALRGHVGVDGIEVQLQRGGVHRQRRQDVALPRECDQAEAVPLEVLHETARLAQRPGQAVGGGIFGEHRARDVHRDDEVQSPGLRDDPLLAPPRSRERDGAEECRDGEGRGDESSRSARGAPRFRRPPQRPPDPHAPRPGGSEPHRPADDRGAKENERGVERHHGTRTTSVAESTISSASVRSPSPRGRRYASSKRR